MAENNSKNTSIGEIIAGVMPFLTSGLMIVLHELPRDLSELAWMRALGGAYFLVAMLLVPAVGVGVGWIRCFPRWAYAYIGQALIFSLYLSAASTPGIEVFGIQLFGRQMWGPRAWFPLLLALGIGLLVTRSLEPLIRLFRNAWEDWTLVTFAMFGLMPLVVWVSFDEIDRAYSLPYMIVTAVYMVLLAWVYMASTRHSRRVQALLVGVVGVLVLAFAGSTFYWLESGGVYIPGMIMWAMVILAVVFSPALIGLLRRGVRA